MTRRWIIDRWRRGSFRSARYQRIVYAPARPDLPRHLNRHVIYVVGTPERPKWATFACPCGYPHTIDLPLTNNATRKIWTIETGQRGPTLNPSVNLDHDGRCHFWLRSGVVHWTPDAHRQAPTRRSR